MENGTMNDDDMDDHRSTSPGITRSSSRGSMNSYGRTSLLRRNQSLSAKQISFYRNGDKFFRGLKLAVSAERYKEWDSLLAELSTKVNLPTGAVRYVFCSETGKMITDINELQYGMNYVCSSSNTFRDVEGGYGQENQPQWSLHNKKAARDELNNWPNEKGATEEVHTGMPRDFIKPKLVTVLRPGKSPQKKVTMLLNCKTAATLNQVLDHLSAKGTLGKVDKLFTTGPSGKQILTLRDLFDDDICFFALSANERRPEEGFEAEIQDGRPPWKVSVIPKSKIYIPGLRPELLPPNKHFTVHLHCILDALSASLESQSPKPRPRSARARSVSPRLYTPKKQPPSTRSATVPNMRPKTAIGIRTPDLGRKSLTPTRMKGDIKTAFKAMPNNKPKAGSEKPVAIKPRPRPKAGSDTPVAIRRPPKPPQILLVDSERDYRSSDSSDSDGVQAKHGYYIYVHGEKVYTNQPPPDAKPTASVRPMLASELAGSDDNQPETLKDFDKEDLKPVQLNVDSGESIETSQ